jgi:hypothetical protein
MPVFDYFNFFDHFNFAVAVINFTSNRECGGFARGSCKNSCATFVAIFRYQKLSFYILHLRLEKRLSECYTLSHFSLTGVILRTTIASPSAFCLHLFNNYKNNKCPSQTTGITLLVRHLLRISCRFLSSKMQPCNFFYTIHFRYVSVAHGALLLLILSSWYSLDLSITTSPILFFRRGISPFLELPSGFM